MLRRTLCEVAESRRSKRQRAESDVCCWCRFSVPAAPHGSRRTHAREMSAAGTAGAAAAAPTQADCQHEDGWQRHVCEQRELGRLLWELDGLLDKSFPLHPGRILAASAS